MTEFQGRARDIDPAGGETRATARLPGLDIDIVHRPAADGGAEHVTIHMTATPSFEAFAHAFEAANPFALWAQSAQLLWMPWLTAARAFALPWAPALPRLGWQGTSGSAEVSGPST